MAYSSSSSSTLSPLAPPFTVNQRLPYGPQTQHPADLGTFYPLYDGAPWNGPFDEGAVEAAGLPSSSQVWTDAGSDGNIWIGARAPAAPTEVTSSGLSFSNAVDYVPSDSVPPCYFVSSVQDGLFNGSKDSSFHYTTYCRPANIISQSFSKSNSSVDRDPKLERPSQVRADSYEMYTKRSRVSVTIREPNMSTNVETDNCVRTDGKVENSRKIDSAPLRLDNKNPSCTGIQIEETKLTVPDLKIKCIAVNNNVEPDSASQNPETVDQYNLAEDSPCWKGVLTSRTSQFHVDDSSKLNEKLDHSVSKTAQVTCTKDSVSDPRLDQLEEQKDVFYFDEFKGGFQPLGCHDASVNVKVTGSTSNFLPHNGIPESVGVRKPFTLDSSCQIRGSSYRHSSNVGSSSIIEQPALLDQSNVSTKVEDGVYLFRALWDLSTFCLGYCNSGIIPSGNDYELLLMTRNNIDACLSKRSIIGEKKEHQYGSVKGEVSQREETNHLPVCKDKGMSDIPTNAHDLPSDFLGSGFPLRTDLAENDAIKDSVKSLLERVSVLEVLNPDSNLYKKLWIAAEVCLCSTKLELQCARAKLGQGTEQLKLHGNNSPGISAPHRSGVDRNIRKTICRPTCMPQPIANKEYDSLPVSKDPRTKVDFFPENDASTLQCQKAVASGLVTSPGGLDSYLMDRYRVLISREEKASSSNAANKEYDSLPVTKDPRTQVDFFLQNDASTSQRQQAVASDVFTSPGDLVDSYLMDPYRVLISLEEKASSSNAALPKKFQSSRTLDAGYGGKDIWLEPSCSDGEFKAALLKISETLGNELLADIYRECMPGKSFLQGIEPSSASSHESENGWRAKEFAGGKKESSSPDWEHVRSEDAVW